MAIEVQTELATYELPAYNAKMAELVEAPMKSTDSKSRWAAQWKVLEAAIGQEALIAEVGGKSTTECDLIALESLYSQVHTAYQMPLIEARFNEVKNSIGSIDVDGIERLVGAVQTLSQINGSRQGFRAVK